MNKLYKFVIGLIATLMTFNAIAQISPTRNLPNLTVNGASSPNNSWIYANSNLSGTGAFATTPKRAAANWWVIQDSAAYPNTGVGSTGLAGGFEWFDHLTTGWDGFRFGYECFIKMDNSPATITNSGTQVSTNINCIKAQVAINANMGGMPGSIGGANGNIFGLNPNIGTNNSATYLALMNDAEFDLNAQAYAGPPAEKMGINLVLSGSCTQPCSAEVPALYNDTAVNIGTNDVSGTSYWDTFINTGNYSHNIASNYSTTYIGAHRRVVGSASILNQPIFKYGVDFSHTLFATPSSTNITISGISIASNLETVTISALGTAPLIGSIMTISGATPASFNGNCVVVISTTTTAACTTANTDAYISGASGVITMPQGNAWQSPGAAIDPNGIVYGSTLSAGLGGITSGTATVGSITVDPQPFAGYVGGAYFNITNPTFHIAAFGSQVAPGTPTTINSAVSAALLMTDNSSFISSATGAPNGTQVSTGCANNDVITLTGGTFTTAAQIKVTTDGSGHVTNATIQNQGAYTVMATAPSYTGGSCSAALGTWLQIGFKVSSITMSTNGSGYPCAPAPEIWTTGATSQINTHGHFVANMTCTAKPVDFPGGITVETSISAPGMSSILAQSAIPMVLQPSGYMDATGHLVLGQTPASSATLSFSGTSGSVTATFSAGTPLTGTSAGDVGRVFTILDTTYKTCTVTVFSSSTVATCTLSATLSGTGPFANANIWISGTNATTNTAGAGGVTFSVPLASAYASAYLYFPASSPIGSAGQYYCIMASTVTGTCYNNTYTSSTPTIPGSPTAFSGLTAGAYTQTTATTLPLLTTTITGNTLGINGCIFWDVGVSNNTSAGNKTVSTKLGTTGPGIAITTGTTGKFVTRACNAGAANSQLYDGIISSPTAVTMQSQGVSRSALNTAVSQNAVVNINLATATDVAALEVYAITLRPN